MKRTLPHLHQIPSLQRHTRQRLRKVKIYHQKRIFPRPSQGQASLGQVFRVFFKFRQVAWEGLKILFMKLLRNAHPFVFLVKTKRKMSQQKIQLHVQRKVDFANNPYNYCPTVWCNIWIVNLAKHWKQPWEFWYGTVIALKSFVASSDDEPIRCFIDVFNGG